MARTLFKLEIDMSNDAFVQDPYGEVVRILRGLANTIEDENLVARGLYDSNGNQVGVVTCPIVR
jgi:hypothetical protein